MNLSEIGAQLKRMTFPFLVVVNGMAIMNFSTSLLAQESGNAPKGPRIKMRDGFTVPIFDEFGRMKGRISGKNAEITAATRETRVTDFKLEAIRPGTQSEIELEILADEATYDKKNARSPGLIEMRSGDGQFLMKGRGFAWNIAEGTLVITNHLETILTPSSEPDEKADENDSDSEKPVGAHSGFVGNWKEISQLKIEAKRLVYSIPEARAIYSGEVKATDPDRLTVVCDQLSLKLRPEEGELDQMVASGAVKVDLVQGSRSFAIASGKSIYRRLLSGSELLVFSDDSPEWESDQGAGAGEVISFYLPEKRIEVRDSATARVAIPEVTREAFTDNFGAEPLFGEHLNIACDSYIYENNRLSLSGVRQIESGSVAIDTSGVRLYLDEDFRAESLEAGPDFKLRGIAAKIPFAISGRDLNLVDMDSESPRARVSGDAEWIYGIHSGRSKTIDFTFPEISIHCVGDAGIKLLIQEWINLPESRFPANVECESYLFKGRNVTFIGGVKLNHPKWNLISDSATITLEETSNRIRSISAENNVYMQADYEVKNESKPIPGLSRFLGGLVQRGVPWEMWCDNLSLIVDNELDRVGTFSAAGNVKMERAGNRGEGNLLQMVEGTDQMEFSGSPSFTMASGTSLRGEESTRFIWNILTQKFKVAGGKYSIHLPEQTFQQSQSP